MLTALCDATIFTGQTFVEGHAVVIKDGKILDIVGRNKTPGEAKIVSFAEKILAPGFIDLQVNGGGNVQFNNTPTAEACAAILKAHRAKGTTRILPACISDRPEITQKAIAAAREAGRKDPGILGIHIEGPHIGSARRGVHKASFVRACTEADLKLYRQEGSGIMLVTLAPEATSPGQIEKLRRQGVIVSLGHTEAEPKEIRAALKAGATGFTHLFNGMGSMSARSPGPSGVALDDDESWCSIIADGHHVSPEMIRLALRAKRPGKVFLVSDAMAPAASEDPKPFKLYNEEIRLENGRCINQENRLAGSAITLCDAVRLCVQEIGIELGAALRMASTYPAAFVGLDKKFGNLLPGYEADLVAIKETMALESVWVAGHPIS